jgi:hypothetical protein
MDIEDNVVTSFLIHQSRGTHELITETPLLTKEDGVFVFIGKVLMREKQPVVLPSAPQPFQK